MGETAAIETAWRDVTVGKLNSPSGRTGQFNDRPAGLMSAQQTWRDGAYRCTNMYADLIRLVGQQFHMNGAVHQLEFGQFGPAHPALASATSIQHNSVRLTFNIGEGVQEFGVVSNDGVAEQTYNSNFNNLVQGKS